MTKATSQYPYSPSWKKEGTSKDAAFSMKPKVESIRNKALKILSNKKDYGATTDEVADLLNLSILSVRPRFTELKLMKKIIETELKRKNSSGRLATVWRAI